MTAPITSHILSPLSIADFLSDYWGRRALFIRGTAEKFADLFSVERFTELMKTTTTGLDGKEPEVRATFDGEDRRDRPEVLTIKPREARAAFAAGATVCVTGIESLDLSLLRTCNRIRAELGYPGVLGFNAYWSPDGAGFGAHFDARIATTLQIAGEKKWRYSKCSAVDWPRANARLDGSTILYNDGGPRKEWETAIAPESLVDWEETTLRAGDVLCLPAGTWHMAAAAGSSLALNLTFNPISAADFLTGILKTAQRADPVLRHMPPLLAHERVHGGVNDRAIEHLDTTLKRSIDILEKMRRDPELLLRTWAESEGQRAPQTVDTSRVEEDSVVELAPGVLVISKPSDPYGIAFVDGREVRMEGTEALAFKLAAAAKETRVQSVASEGHGPSELVAAFQKLTDAGVLRLAPGAKKVSLDQLFKGVRSLAQGKATST